ncbi:MAG: hypothetical protein IPL28_05245 [Chloroflexi bacterium]|nr:hypothetical protein [Chloroflexota bacterium]
MILPLRRRSVPASEFRGQRDNGKVAELRGQLETAARTDENLLPLFIACVENDVTLGEICHTLRGVWGISAELCLRKTNALA